MYIKDEEICFFLLKMKKLRMKKVKLFLIFIDFLKIALF
jgi:hypothetical protein